MEQRRRNHMRKLLGLLSEDELAAFLVGLRAVKAAGAEMHAAAVAARTTDSQHQAPARRPAQSAEVGA
jgi:predicted DNA-binding transcriptional regulator YafY